MEKKRIRRMIGKRKGNVCVLCVQYRTERSCSTSLTGRNESHEDLHRAPVYG